mgnify:CR=1 FL=1
MAKFIDIVLRAKDLFSAKTDKAAESIGSLKTEIKALDKELKAVEKTQEAVEVFSALSVESKGLAQALEQAQVSVQKFGKQQADASQKAAKAEQEYKTLKAQVAALNSSYSKQNKSLTDNNASLEKAKTQMAKYGDAVTKAKQNVESTTAKYLEQKQVFDQLEKKYKGTRQPLDKLSDSYKNAKAQLTSLEQVHKSQLKTLTTAEAKYQAAQDDMAGLDKAQRSYATALEKTEKSLHENTQAQQQALTKQKEANTELAAATANYKASAAAITQLSKRLTKANADLDKANSKLKAAGVDSNNLADATDKLANKQKKLTTETKKAFSSLTTLTAKLKGVKGALSRAGTGVAGFTGQLTALAGTYIGIRGITTSLLNFVNVGAKFETFRKQFEGIMGSVAEGEQAFEWVKAFARETPLDMEQTTQAFVMLKGAGLDPMDGTLKALTDSTAKYTGGTARLENITRQLSQAWAKGRINAEDMRIAVDNGLPAWVLLEQATGKNVGELRKLSEQGRLGRYELKLLFAEMQNDAPNAAAKLMQTFSGQMAVAKFNVQEFLDTVAQSGALDFLTDKMTSFNAQMRIMSDDGSLKTFAQELSDRFVGMAKDVSGALKALFTDLKGFTKNVSDAFDTASIPINLFTAGVRSLIITITGAFELTLLGLSKIHSAFGLIETPISKATKAASEFFAELRKEALKQATADANKMRAAFDRLSGSTDKVKTGIDGIGESSGNLQKLVEPLAGAFNLTSVQALEMAKNILASGDALNDAGIPADRLRATVDVLIAKLKDDPSPAVQAIVAKISAQYQKLDSAVKKPEETLEDLELKFSNFGGKTLKSLQESVANTVRVFDAFKEAKKPINELRQAFLQQLDAQVALANATEQSFLPSALSLQASQLGLTDAFNKANGEVEKNYNLLNILKVGTDNLTAAEQRLLDQKNKSKDTTEEQTDKQKGLNAANAKAASHAGANIAFQKLWNEAKARSLKLYDLLTVSTEKLTQRTKELGESLSGAFRNQSWSNILKPINDLNNLAKRNELQAIEQTKAYKKLFESIENGTVSLKDLSFYTQNASSLFDKLSDTNLSALQDQINNAKAATADLKDELSDTIHDLKNELDDLEGNKSQVLARDYEADKIELKEQLKSAEKTGDAQALADAREALSIAEKIYRIKSKAIVSEQKEQIKTTKTVNENSNTSTNIKEVRQVQEVRYTVTLAVGGRSSTFNSTTGSNVEQLMTALAESGFTVTRT